VPARGRIVTVARDRRFLDLVSVVIGGLVGLAVGIYVLANYVGGRATEREEKDDAEYQRQVEERIAPIGRVAIAGQDNSALAIAAARGAAAAAAPGTVLLSGEETYKTTCSACHAAGLAGAPKFGDKTAWAPRIAQGVALLRTHALAGVTSKAGVMPAKGGRVDLADQSVASAVDYMVAAAK
jgi:cytochrome c5